MSAVVGPGSTPAASWRDWFAAPLAIWRLLRVLVHVLKAYADSYLFWRNLDEKAWHHFVLRWNRELLDILGIQLEVTGQARAGAKLVVANHVSWLDIIAINAVEPSRFVSKAEVGQWPLVGRLVKAAGTLLLIRERRRDAMRVLGLMAQSMRDGRTVAVFPEGTTGTGHGIMHFHGNLLQSAIDAAVPVQPIVLRYSDPEHAVSPKAAYVGDTNLVQSLWWIATARGLCIHAHIPSPQAVAHADRRALAKLLHSHMAECLGAQIH